jgi:hypothetical protein
MGKRGNGERCSGINRWQDKKGGKEAVRQRMRNDMTGTDARTSAPPAH